MANTKRLKSVDNRLQDSNKELIGDKQRVFQEGGDMNDKLKTVLIARYQADIADAKYKIKCFDDHEIVIPEHFDITGEIDKLLEAIASAEDKMAVLRLHYGENKTEKTVL
jgi:hypothetical protein